jgi:hypothetical protein
MRRCPTAWWFDLDSGLTFASGELKSVEARGTLVERTPLVGRCGRKRFGLFLLFAVFFAALRAFVFLSLMNSAPKAPFASQFLKMTREPTTNSRVTSFDARGLLRRSVISGALAHVCHIALKNELDL